MVGKRSAMRTIRQHCAGQAHVPSGQSHACARPQAQVRTRARAGTRAGAATRGAARALRDETQAAKEERGLRSRRPHAKEDEQAWTTMTADSGTKTTAQRTLSTGRLHEGIQPRADQRHGTLGRTHTATMVGRKTQGRYGTRLQEATGSSHEGTVRQVPRRTVRQGLRRENRARPGHLLGANGMRSRYKGTEG